MGIFHLLTVTDSELTIEWTFVSITITQIERVNLCKQREDSIIEVNKTLRKEVPKEIGNAMFWILLYKELRLLWEISILLNMKFTNSLSNWMKNCTKLMYCMLIICPLSESMFKGWLFMMNLYGCKITPPSWYCIKY